MLSGLLPFFVVIIELAFIFRSLWQDQYQYVYGFLLLVFTFLIITCVEVTIVVICTSFPRFLFPLSLFCFPLR
jgi:transmembrane 9 superfamily protein 2/4